MSLSLLHSLIANIRGLLLRIRLIFIYSSLAIITILKLWYNLWLLIFAASEEVPPLIVFIFVVCGHWHFWFILLWIVLIVWLRELLVPTILLIWLIITINLPFFYDIIFIVFLVYWSFHISIVNFKSLNIWTLYVKVLFMHLYSILFVLL